MFAVKEWAGPQNMSRQIRLDLIQPAGNLELARLQGGQVILGREPDEGGLAIPNQAISRNHAMLSRIRSHWFFKDLGSTNGSWVNGVQAREGAWKLIRPGDSIQLADSVVAISDAGDGGGQRVTGFPALGGVSVIVFSKGEFVDEFPVPDYGRALVIGGQGCDLEIEGSLNDAASLIVERLSANVCAHTVSKNIHVLLNEKELNTTVNLKDRDEMRVAHYYMIFNNPPVSGPKNLAMMRPEPPVVGEQPAPPTGNWKEWGEPPGNQYQQMGGGSYAASTGQSSAGQSGGTRGIFGTAMPEGEFTNEETIAIDPEEVERQISGYDMHPSMRHMMIEEEEPNPLATLDEKIVFVLGILLLVGLFCLMLYWLMG